MAMRPNEINVLDGVTLENLKEYVSGLNGWKLGEVTSKFCVYYGTPDDNGIPVELILPKSPEISDLQSRMKDALQLLSLAQDLDEKEVAERIKMLKGDAK